MSPDPEDATASADKEAAEEIAQFTEQARWLISFHQSRSDSLCTRAVALLGFVGVILALLLGAGIPDGVNLTACIRIAYGLAVVALLATSCFALLVLSGRELQAPGVQQVRDNWRSWITKERRGRVATDIAETFLLAKSPDGKSPVEWTMEAANARADWFNRTIWGMAASLVFLAGLLIAVAGQLYT